MKLTSIDLYSNDNQVAALSFKDPMSKNPYIAQQVTGLDADEIVPKFYGTNLAGTTNYTELAINKREVVLLVALNPKFSQGKSYSDLRDDLYRGIAASRDGTVQIRLKNGTHTVGALTGFVTKFETGLFSKTPQAQITIRCDAGMIRALDEVHLDVEYISTDTTIPDALSTAPHGMKFSLSFDAPSASFVVRDATAPDWSFTVTYSFLAGDVLYFSSAYDGRYVYIDRSGTDIYLVDKISVGSSWPMMFPGANDLQFIADGAITFLTYSYYPTYWGV